MPKKRKVSNIRLAPGMYKVRKMKKRGYKSFNPRKGTLYLVTDPSGRNVGSGKTLQSAKKKARSLSKKEDKPMTIFKSVGAVTRKGD